MKKFKSTIKSWEELEVKLRELGQAEINAEVEAANMNLEVINLKKMYQPKINFNLGVADGLRMDIEAFCKEHKKEFEGAVKSRRLIFGKVGFRFTPSSLKLLKGHGWESVKVKFADLFKFRYIKVVTTLDKKQITEDATAEVPLLTEEQLAACGVRIGRTEKFFYEIDKEQVQKLIRESK